MKKTGKLSTLELRWCLDVSDLSNKYLVLLIFGMALAVKDQQIAKAID